MTVVRYAVPKLNVDSQGVPLKSKGKKRSSVQVPQYPAPASESLPTPPEEEAQDAPYAGTYNPVPDRPPKPFHELDPETFPVAELGGDFTPLLDPNGWTGEAGPMHFAEALEGRYPQTDRGDRARQIIASAQNNHTLNGSSKLHVSDNATTDIPVGHVRVEPLIPSIPNHEHVVKVHYPQGRVTAYRARLNDDDTGYR